MAPDPEPAVEHERIAVKQQPSPTEDPQHELAHAADAIRPNLSPSGPRAWAPAAPGEAAEAPQINARITLAHDYLLVLRGAERTFAAMADLFPNAPIFTLLCDRELVAERFAGHEITVSRLQRLGATQSSFRRLLPLYPGAAARLTLPPSDLVLTSSSAFAHGVHAPPGAVHICYCHAPFRYVWNEQARALGEVAKPLRPLLRVQLARMRRWDKAASARVDHYIANSQTTRRRIREYYNRDAVVIHPPVETDRFKQSQPGDALLVISELVRHKRVHLALEAARRAGAPIEVIGSGPDEEALRAEFPETAFLGRVGDDELVERCARARAVVVPAIEEFGITAVEAQAAGRPVIAAAAGGVLETVLPGQTGLLAAPDDVDAFAAAIRELDRLEFSPAAAVANAQRFSVASFQRRLADYVGQVLQRRAGDG
jgi:glycosyltransferase involved in cell wall biosynthesis